MRRLICAGAFASLALIAAAPVFAKPAPAAAPEPIDPATPPFHALPAIRYQVLKSGDPAGQHPTRQDTVLVNYELKLRDGTVIDSSFKRGQPAEFPLSKLIPGWQAVVPLMVPGDDWRVLIPAEYGYGAKGKDPVPPNAELDFHIQLLAIVQTPPPAATPPAAAH